MGDIAKLPKWARDHIERLQVSVEAAEQRAASAFGERKTAIEVGTSRRYGDPRPRIFVPDTQVIEFTIDGGKIDAQLRDGCLELCGNSIMHNHLMVILPQISNVISLQFVLRDRADK